MSKLWDAPQNAFIDIVHWATDEPIGMTVELKPRSHIDVKRVERKHQDEARQAVMRRGKLPSAARDEARGIELLSSAIAGWKWDDEVPRDRRIEYSAEAADDLLKDDNFRSQLDRAWGIDANFYQD